MSRDKKSDIQIKILNWNNQNDGIKKWAVKSLSGSVNTDYEISLLKADCNFHISRNGLSYIDLKSDSMGKILFSCEADSEKEYIFEIGASE